MFKFSPRRVKEFLRKTSDKKRTAHLMMPSGEKEHSSFGKQVFFLPAIC